MPPPCPPAIDAVWLHVHAHVVWAAGDLVAADDQQSVLGRLVRRQLVAVDRLDVPQLLVGAARAHPAARTPTATAVAAWAAAQHDLTWHGSLLELQGDRSRWLQHTDQPFWPYSSTRTRSVAPTCSAH